MEKSEGSKFLISIPNFRLTKAGSKEVAFYKIVVKSEKDSWELEHRFSEFDTLYNELSKRINGLPSIPSKYTGLWYIAGGDINEDRRLGLQKFLQDLVIRKDVFSSKEFIEFLELDQHQPESQIAQMEMVGEFKHLIFGFRDAVFVPEQNLFFAALGELEVLSRFDNLMSSIGIPWGATESEKKSGMDSIGALELWEEKNRKNDVRTYGKGWGVGHKSQGICVAFSKKLMRVALGLDSGEISIYRIDDFKKGIKEIMKEKAHSMRVMGLGFIEKRSLLYSIGEDGFLRCINLKSLFVMSEAEVSKSKLTCLKIHEPSNTACITDRSGNVFFYDLFSDPPTKRVQFELPSACVIRGLDIDFEEGKVFISSYDNGYLYYYKCRMPITKDTRFEKVGIVKGYSYPRNLFYQQIRRELFVGDGNGIITCLDIDKFENGPIGKFYGLILRFDEGPHWRSPLARYERKRRSSFDWQGQENDCKHLLVKYSSGSFQKAGK